MGQVVCIMGESGAGRTSFVILIIKLHLLLTQIEKVLAGKVGRNNIIQKIKIMFKAQM